MKKKVKFGRDSNECDAAPVSRKARIPLKSFTDEGFERQTFGLVKEVMKQHDAEPCSGAANLTIRLKFPKGARVGEVDVEEDESALPNMSMSATMLANYTRKQEFALMDNSEATCQIEGCTANLSRTNGYFRRNKVCQEHFKAFKVEVGDFEQRYCQQCNRFHMLAEFDEDKRNCRLTLAGHNRWKGSHPEATSVLSTGTLVYLPGKVRQGGKSLGPVASPPCDDLERTITNEESTDSENTLNDDASSGLAYKEKGFYNPELANPVSSQITSYLESIGKTKSEKLFPAHVMKEEALLLEPTSDASVSAALRVCSSKSCGSKRRSAAQSGHTSVCQVEGCLFDLSNTKDYFKRRKVCERHFKAFKVKVHNVDQRFCQQCSRFHVLAEFDEGRKSCKRMLMGHNMRRRKGHAEAVSRKISKEAKKEDDNNVKAPQSLNPIGKPPANLGFETHREKTPALTN